MNTSIKNDILLEIKDYYLKSNDFNGYPIRYILVKFKLSDAERNEILIELIQENLISLNFGDIHPNSYIKAYPEEEPEIQIDKLNSIQNIHICAYPTTNYMKKVLDVTAFIDKPFTRKLALGEPQLSYEFFDLSILEIYRNDPRYFYYNNDISGQICAHNEFLENNLMSKSDSVFIDSFGFAHNIKGNRAIAVHLRYLSPLSAEHQNVWWAKRLINEKYQVHPDYLKITNGRWDLGISIYSAFLLEIEEINKLCKIMNRPSFFSKEFSEEERPKEFGFLIRPTSKEFNNFILILDKLISENINRKFFRNDILFYSIEKDSEGKEYNKEKGTINILEDWLSLLFRNHQDKPYLDLIKTFKEIRKLRQSPAHKLDDNVFDFKYLEQQNNIIERAYRGLQALRIIFSSNPKCKNYKPPEELENGIIWTN